MRAGSGQDQCFIYHLVDKKPIRGNVKIPEAVIVTMEGMIVQSLRQVFSSNEKTQDLFKLVRIFTLLEETFEVALELRLPDDFTYHPSTLS